MYKFHRITLLAGHYGSGKTNIAINMALVLASITQNIALADMDIVNPYFRSLDSRDLLESHGVRVVCSQYANTNLDIPALPKEIYELVADRNIHAVFDIGGDDRGATALGRYADSIVAEDDYEMFLVINKFRPLTRTPEDCDAVKKEIEAIGKIPFTGIINNSNLGIATTENDILNSLSYAERVSDITELPVVFTSANRSLCNGLRGKINNLLPLDISSLI